ncbi:hypothetical protein B296_00024650 [Ensete ventricosum]|uniref:Uncharacterized protein n=1 Tax=Ensete ventricosum TaxID=4639 RepID=A0A426ZPB5_ENSVE|nr:hypothetical protein B296_00024650 [Ensete ventricosum]
MSSSTKVSALDMPDVPMGQLPEHLHLQRTRVVCKADAPIHVRLTFTRSRLSHSVDLLVAYASPCDLSLVFFSYFWTF